MNDMEGKKNITQNTPLNNDTVPKVTLIGGTFFFSDNPDETKEW